MATLGHLAQSPIAPRGAAAIWHAANSKPPAPSWLEIAPSTPQAPCRDLPARKTLAPRLPQNITQDPEPRNNARDNPPEQKKYNFLTTQIVQKLFLDCFFFVFSHCPKVVLPHRGEKRNCPSDCSPVAASQNKKPGVTAQQTANPKARCSLAQQRKHTAQGQLHLCDAPPNGQSQLQTATSNSNTSTL